MTVPESKLIQILLEVVRAHVVVHLNQPRVETPCVLDEVGVGVVINPFSRPGPSGLPLTHNSSYSLNREGGREQPDGCWVD